MKSLIKFVLLSSLFFVPVSLFAEENTQTNEQKIESKTNDNIESKVQQKEENHKNKYKFDLSDDDNKAFR